jgi:hypothetical protein
MLGAQVHCESSLRTPTPLTLERRIWSLDRPALRAKLHTDVAQYRQEVCNLRFYNVVAKAYTPRLLACDDAALALLLEDTGGLTAHEAEMQGNVQSDEHAWLRILTALACAQALADARMQTLRRLYAPHWPPIAPPPAPRLLEQATENTMKAGQRLLSRAERGVLMAADSWLQSRLSAALTQQRRCVLGIKNGADITLTGDRVLFMDLSHAPLGLPAADLAPLWKRPDRRE